jgi:hypothetical protein
MPDRLIPDPNTVAIRLYGQGLGDCFLLASPAAEAGADPCYVVIDCGIAKNTPDEEARMAAVVADIGKATGGVIDILAITHEHYDHISGFFHSKAAWQALTVRSLWLPWTEIEGDPDADTLREKKNSLNLAAARAVERSLRTADPEALSGLRMQSGFLGVDLGAPAEGFAAANAVMAEALEIVKGLCPADRHVFCEPGEVRPLPRTGIRAFVLGPPRPKVLRKPGGRSLVRLLEDEKEMYGYRDIGQTPDSGGGHSMALGAGPERDALAQALIGDLEDDEFDRYCPFDGTQRIPWDEAMLQPFFWEHYTSAEAWRRVDDDWLGAAPELALRAGGLTNNVSLVLAFELPQSKKVLLFPGDAQVGNWLSWHKIEQWKEDGAPPAPADMKDLLARVCFYKLGHHGSHNATVREQGLELMAKGPNGEDTDLTAYVPVSVPVAHDVMRYCPMPFYPVMTRLRQKTAGRVFLASGQLVQPLPSGTDAAALEAGVTRSPETLKAKTYKGKKIEDAVPLWLQVSIPDA